MEIQHNEETARVGSVFLKLVSVSEGTPQGSVLSCTCFVVAIDSISESLTHDVKGALYVDDFTIYVPGHIIHLIERRIQVVIYKYCTTNRVLCFPREKLCQCIHAVREIPQKLLMVHL